MVSETAPTRMSVLIVKTPSPETTMPSRFTVLKPCRLNVTEYAPGNRSTSRYCPVPSVIAVRVFSMSAGLAASTVTPGRTAPDGSFTVPAIDACAWAATGARSVIPSKHKTLKQPRIVPPLCEAHRPTDEPCQTVERRINIYFTRGLHPIARRIVKRQIERMGVWVSKVKQLIQKAESPT